MHNILIVDDHQLIRVGIARLLESVPDARVIGEAGSGEEAIDKVAELLPTVVFMDLRMPGIGGAEATRRILRKHPDMKLVILTAVNDNDYPRRMLRAGASAYMTKSADAAEISKALHVVGLGEVYISPELAQQMIVRGAVNSEASVFQSLSPREMEIAVMLASGHRAGEIAALCNVSSKTINTHKYRIHEKVNVNNDVELALAAVKYGLIDPEQVI
ncbi:MAG: response regulator [bacterium]